jgi:hypothetical protein
LCQSAVAAVAVTHVVDGLGFVAAADKRLVSVAAVDVRLKMTCFSSNPVSRIADNNSRLRCRRNTC